MKNYISQIRIIYYAILGAIALFASILVIVKPPAEASAPSFSGFDSWEIIISVVISALAISAKYVFKKLVSDTPLTPDKLRTAFVVQLAMLEMSMMISLIMYMIHNNQIYLIYLMLISVYYISLYPSIDKLKDEIKL